MPDTSASTPAQVSDPTPSEKRISLSEVMDALAEALRGISDSENPTDPKVVSKIQDLYENMNEFLREDGIIPADWCDEFFDLLDTAERFLYPRPPTPDCPVEVEDSENEEDEDGDGDGGVQLDYPQTRRSSRQPVPNSRYNAEIYEL